MIISIFSGLMFAVNSSLYIVWLRRTRPFRDLEAELWMATSKKSYIQCWIVAVNWCCQQLCFGTCYTPAFRRQLYCEDSAPRTLTSLDKHPAQTCDSFCRWSGSKSFEALCSAVSFCSRPQVSVHQMYFDITCKLQNHVMSIRIKSPFWKTVVVYVGIVSGFIKHRKEDQGQVSASNQA